MNKRNILILLIGLAIVSLILWYTLSPLFIDKIVDEEIPVSGSESTNESLNENLENPINSAVYEGNFVDADSFHKVSGIAKIISEEDKNYLRLEDFQATNGPDLYVYLSTDTQASDFIDLGTLKGNIGNQNYEIVEPVDLEKYDKVLIWCKRFSVLFGSADIDKVNGI